jgi:predicted nucleic-acid-binding protein
MIGLDTNVLLRLFVEDDPQQNERARGFFEAVSARETCVVNPVVLAEFAWTLVRGFRKKRREVAHLIAEVLSADDVEISNRSAAERALTAYRSGNADFPDYFLAEINLELGCASTATFDKAALDSSAFSPVP